jgi:hypothetical protein
MYDMVSPVVDLDFVRSIFVASGSDVVAAGAQPLGVVTGGATTC